MSLQANGLLHNVGPSSFPTALFNNPTNLYGNFSIGWSQSEELIRYIDRKEKHHGTKTFQQEYRELLRKYHMEFDERYVWD
jgi:hypothetical protein